MDHNTIAAANETVDTMDDATAASEFRRLQEKYSTPTADALISHIDSLAEAAGDAPGGDSYAELQETIEHMHGQLGVLYAEKDLLEQRIDTSDADGIIQSLEGLEAQLSLCYSEKEERALRGLEDELSALDSLELQLQNLYNEREGLEAAYGVSTAEDIRLMLDNLNSQLAVLYKERESYVIMDGDALVIQGPRKFFIKKADA